MLFSGTEMLTDGMTAVVGCICMALVPAVMADPVPESPYRLSADMLREFRARDDPSYRLVSKSTLIPESSAAAPQQPQIAAELADKPCSKE